MQFLKIYNLTNQKIVYISILVVQLFLMLWMSQDAGISADEDRHHQQAEKVFNYYKTHGEDKSALENTGTDPMQYNGQSFDNLMYLIEEKLNIENYMEMRHFFNALTGWLIILITGLIARRIYGYEGAILAIFLLFISPRFLGHAMNNNKDIPFALGFVLSMYGMIRFLNDIPKLKIKNILLLTLGIGIAISIRLAGILSIAFLGLYSLVLFITKRPVLRIFNKQKLNILKKLLFTVPFIAIAGYFIGIAFWPFMMKDPIKNIKIVLDATTSHPVSLNQLFEGKLILSTKLPSYYSLKYLSISYPIVILFGIVLSFVLAPFRLKRSTLFLYFIISFSFVFVFFWMSYKNSNIYGGIRHLLFIYPLAICLAVFGFIFLKDLMNKFSVKWIYLIPYGILVLLSLGPIIHIIKNYPYSYIYFNELAGGVKKAAYSYETDYFQHSLRHATEWVIENEINKLKSDSTKIMIATNDYSNTEYYLRNKGKRVTCYYTRYYEKSKENWDYAIFYCGYISPNQLKDGLWPPKETIHTEDVDGIPIGAVVKRISHDDYNGFEALKKGRLDEAKQDFKNFLKLYPENEEVLEGYSRAFLTERNLDSALYYANLSINYNPRQIGALYLKSSVLNTNKDYQGALDVANQMIDIKSDFVEAQYQKGYALKNLNQPNEALKAFQLAIGYKKDYTQAYYEIGNIFCNYKNYAKAIEIYDKVLELQPNDFYGTVYKAKCLQMSGKNDQAEELLNKLPTSNQNNVEVVKVRCRIAMAKNNWNLAANYLNMARFINNDADLFVLRSKFVSLAQNNKTTAENYIKSAIKLDPINREAQEIQNSLQTNAKPVQQNQVNPKQQQSIMFQKPEKKKISPITVPTR